MAALVVAEPEAFVNTASYSLPLSARVVPAMVKVSLVAPGTAENVAPPSVETSHCTVGIRKPLAAALKVASCPANTDWLVGLVVIDGAAGSMAIVTKADCAKGPELNVSGVLPEGSDTCTGVVYTQNHCRCRAGRGAVAELTNGVIAPGVDVPIRADRVAVPYPSPMAVAVTPVGSETCTGVSVVVVESSPSAPSALLPQA